MSRLFTACVIVALASCAQPTDANGDGIADSAEGGRNPDSVSLLAPSTPIGTVSGTVLSTTNMPLEGVTVSLVVGTAAEGGKTATATTDSSGAFNFNDVPGESAVQLTYSKAGYATARSQVYVSGSTGNIPVNNANGNAGFITLTALTATVTFHVYSWNGTPAEGAVATLDVSPSAFVGTSGVLGSNAGTVTVQGTVGADGTLSFMGVPDPVDLARLTNAQAYTLVIGALDKDANGVPESLGTVKTYTAQALFTNAVTPIVLGDPRNAQPLQILASNLGSFLSSNSEPFRNAVNNADPITVVFNQPIVETEPTRLVKVVKDDCQGNWPVSVTQVSPAAIRIIPNSPWVSGNRYNIAIRATGSESGDTGEFTGYFFGLDSTTPLALSNTIGVEVRKATGNTMANAWQPGDEMFVRFNVPITEGGAAPKALINFDITGDNQIGGNTGFNEYNGPGGFTLTNAEQTQATNAEDGTFVCKASGYSARYRVNFSLPPLGSVTSVPTGTLLHVIFPNATTSAAAYQTIWGASVPAGDLSGALTVVQ